MGELIGNHFEEALSAKSLEKSEHIALSIYAKEMNLKNRVNKVRTLSVTRPRFPL